MIAGLPDEVRNNDPLKVQVVLSALDAYTIGVG